MTNVDLGGVEVEVEPIAEMAAVRAMTASLIMSRYSSAIERDDPVGAEDAATDLLAYCTEGVRPATIETLDAEEIERLYAVILPDTDGTECEYCGHTLAIDGTCINPDCTETGP